MGEVFAYSLISSLVLTLLYLMYKGVLASENFHSLNRTLIWMIYLVSLTAPPLLFFADSLLTSPQPANIALDFEDVVNTVAEIPVKSPSLLPSIILWIYLAGMTLAAAMTAINFLKIYQIIKTGTEVEIEGEKVYPCKIDRTIPVYCRAIRCVPSV